MLRDLGPVSASSPVLNGIWEDRLLFLRHDLGVKHLSLISIFQKFTILFMWSCHRQHDTPGHINGRGTFNVVPRDSEAVSA